MTALSDIFGQEAAVQNLRAAMKSDHLPHGLIFSGPAGIGKGTTATALATWFLCEHPRKDDACGKCQSCLAMAGAAHPDFHWVTRELARVHDKSGTSKATQISVAVIRHEVVVPAGRKTTLGRGKVFVVEQAELMNEAAQNALLKTLEEPPGRTLIVLLTSHISDLLATIRSRCQIVRFAPLPLALVQSELKRRGLDATAAAWCEGSLGAALRWIEDGVVPRAVEIVKTIDAILASGPSPTLPELLKISAAAQAEKTLTRDELASKDAATREALLMYLSIAATRLRRVLSEVPDAARLDRACRSIEALTRAEKYLDANVNVALVLEQLGVTIGA